MSENESKEPIIFKKKKVKSLRQRKRSVESDSDEEDTKKIR